MFLPLMLSLVWCLLCAGGDTTQYNSLIQVNKFSVMTLSFIVVERQSKYMVCYNRCQPSNIFGNYQFEVRPVPHSRHQPDRLILT